MNQKKEPELGEGVRESLGGAVSTYGSTTDRGLTRPGEETAPHDSNFHMEQLWKVCQGRRKLSFLWPQRTAVRLGDVTGRQSLAVLDTQCLEGNIALPAPKLHRLTERLGGSLSHSGPVSYTYRNRCVFRELLKVLLTSV